MNPQPTYPALAKSYKGLFPFKIGTTSFIYPDHYLPNVKMLGAYVDEIELLLYESLTPDALPSRSVISALGRLAADFDLSYNVHLPTDVSLSDLDPAGQAGAVDTICRVIERVHPLQPSALVLHVPYNAGALQADKINSWQDRVYKNLAKIISGVGNQEIIAIETLDYPLELLEGIIFDLDLGICLDLGHLMVYDYDILEVFDKYASKTAILHLHGVDSDRDHTTLARLSEELLESVLQVLKRFTGVVSLEVFSFENLDSSLKLLESRWKKR